MTSAAKTGLPLNILGFGLRSKAWFINMDKFQGCHLYFHHKVLLRGLQAKFIQSAAFCKAQQMIISN